MCNTDKMLKRLGNYKCDGQLSIFDMGYLNRDQLW